MELISNNSIPQQMASNNSSPNTTNSTTAERLLAGILDSFPSWDINAGVMNSAGSNNA